MAANTQQKRAEELRAQIRRHDRLYYQEAEPEITDLEYDKLIDELKDLESEFPELVTADSPTQRVGEEISGDLNQVEHRIPMLSIENTYSLDELKTFLARVDKQLEATEENPVEWVLELKIDGVAAAIIYEDGLLSCAITRGNGVIGDDITHNIRTIGDVPLRLDGDAPKILEVRGEVYMRNSDLAQLNLVRAEQGQAPFANPRNVTAGTIRLQDPKIAAERKMRFFCHGVGYCEGMSAQDHMNFLGELRSYGLPATPHVHLFKSSEQVIEQIDALQEQLHELDFEVDGLVLKVNRFDRREKLGATSKSPRWIVAYKIEKYEATTKLNDIRVQVGKTGAVTPVAELEPVQLAGTTVSRASLHNAEEIERKDVRVGDWVVVEKAGKIIPHIVRVELHRRSDDAKEFGFPTTCPECSTKLEKDEGGVYIRCTNERCPAKLRQRLRYFASREAMDIDGLGEKIVDQLVDAELVGSFADLYSLEYDELLKLERFGAGKATKLLKGIEASKNKPFSSVLTGISIRHVGKRVAKLLSKHFTTIEALQAATVEELADVDEIGDIIAESVHEFLSSTYGQDVVSGLKASGVCLESEKQPDDSSDSLALEGKTLVVTGTLVKYKRDEIKDLIEKHGGRASSSVSKSTDYLVAGEKAGSKLTKAKDLGIEVLTEDQFETLISD